MVPFNDLSEPRPTPNLIDLIDTETALALQNFEYLNFYFNSWIATWTSRGAN